MEYFYHTTSYDALVTGGGAEIVASESDDDYQGDTYYLLKQGDQYGYTVVGWGSCSGCDALEACDTQREVESLGEELRAAIHWGTAVDICEHIAKRNPANDWYARSLTFKRFQRAALAALDVCEAQAA